MEISRFDADRDRLQLLDICKTVWGGTDYIPKVIDAWVLDPHIHLVSIHDRIQHGPGEILSLVSFGVLWDMECGLFMAKAIRTHPQAKQRGYASSIIQHLVEMARSMGAKEFRYLTWAKNPAMIRIASKFGLDLMHTSQYFEFLKKSPYLEQIRSNAEDAAMNLSNRWRQVNPEDFDQIREALGQMKNIFLRQNLLFEFDFYPIESTATASLVKDGSVYLMNDSPSDGIAIITKSWEISGAFNCSITTDSVMVAESALHFAIRQYEIDGKHDLLTFMTEEPPDGHPIFQKNTKGYLTFPCFSVILDHSQK